MTEEKRQQALMDYQAESKKGRLGTGFTSLKCSKCGAPDNFLPLDGDMMVCDECGAKQMAPVSVRSAYAGLWKDNL